MLKAELFNSEIRSRRCFNCQQYTNHSARYCKGPIRYRWCAKEGHKASECPTRNVLRTKACAPCGGTPGHYALDIYCLRRYKDNERAKTAYITRPSCFEIYTTPSPSSLSRLPSRSLSLGPKLEDKGFIIIRSKRRRGRPSNILKANIIRIPNIATFL